MSTSPSFIIAKVSHIITILFAIAIYQTTSSPLYKSHSRTLLTSDASSPWSSRSRPNIFISGDEHSGRPHAFEESRAFFERYNQHNDSTSVNELRFVIIGDQGGHHHHPTPEYINTARTIAARHRRNPYHAMITTGDNIYNDGITESEFHIMDILTKNIFQGLGLNNIPWFFVLGNHDHCLDPFAQVLYSKQQLLQYLHSPDGVNHPIVVLPDFFYDIQFEFGLNHTRVHMMMIDSMINRAEYDRYSGCKDPRVTHQHKSNKKTIYKQHLKREQFAWMQKTLQLVGMPGVDYRVIVGHHVPFSTSKWRGCDYMRQLLDSLQPDEGHDSVLDLFVGGHDHLFEFGWTSNPLFPNAVVGGTRSCDGVGWVNKIKNLFADIPTGRITTAVSHSFHYKYWEYWLNVVLNGGWRGCEGGGFVELMFRKDPDVALVATIIFYSGSGTELYKRDISAMITTESEAVLAETDDGSFAIILKNGDSSRDTVHISERDFAKWRSRKHMEFLAGEAQAAEFSEWLRLQENELSEYLSAHQRDDSIFFDESQEVTHPDIHD